MTHVTMYDSMDSMQEALKGAEERANALVTPWQRKITYGDKFVIYEPSYDLWVFCDVLTEAKLFEGTDDKVMRASERVSYSRGYRACRVYSELVDHRGEVESVHILKALDPLSEEEWEVAKQINFRPKTFIEAEGAAASTDMVLEYAARKLIAKLIIRANTPGAIRFV